MEQLPDLCIRKPLIGPNGTVAGHEFEALVKNRFHTGRKPDLGYLFHNFNHQGFNLLVFQKQRNRFYHKGISPKGGHLKSQLI